MKLKWPWSKANKPGHRISRVSFETVEPIWRDKLWKDRISPIEPCSAITPQGQIDMALMSQEAFFWACKAEDKIIGVMSGFQTSNQEFRLRGVWVDEDFRQKDIGTQLLERAITQAKELRCKKVWTMPRSTSWGFYQSNGFKMTGETSAFEFGPHYFAEKEIVSGQWE